MSKRRLRFIKTLALLIPFLVASLVIFILGQTRPNFDGRLDIANAQKLSLDLKGATSLINASEEDLDQLTAFSNARFFLLADSIQVEENPGQIYQRLILQPTTNSGDAFVNLSAPNAQEFDQVNLDLETIDTNYHPITLNHQPFTNSAGDYSVRVDAPEAFTMGLTLDQPGSYQIEVRNCNLIDGLNTKDTIKLPFATLQIQQGETATYLFTDRDQPAEKLTFKLDFRPETDKVLLNSASPNYALKLSDTETTETNQADFMLSQNGKERVRDIETEFGLQMENQEFLPVPIIRTTEDGFSVRVKGLVKAFYAVGSQGTVSLLPTRLQNLQDDLIWFAIIASLAFILDKVMDIFDFFNLNDAS